ncbi:16869_t:CDS:2, partial [Gigaspora rosea]
MISSSLKLDGNLAEINSDYKKTKNKDISYSEVKTSIEIRDFGGDKSKFKSEKIDPWQDSLNDDYKYWCIIEYDNIIPIFNILDDNLRQEVINITMGLRILHSGIEPIKATIIQPSRPFEHKLKHLPNLKGRQIFASIMGDKEKKDVFSICVVYLSDSSASIILHRINDNKTEKKSVSINNSITNNNYENIYEQFQEENLCILATCAQQAPNDEYETAPQTSTITTGIHFCCEKDQLKACVFTYYLESQKLNYMKDSHINNHLVQYCIIPTSQRCLFDLSRVTFQKVFNTDDIRCNIPQTLKRFWKCDPMFISLFHKDECCNIG